MCVINLEGMVQHVNAPFLRLFGYRRGELEGTNVAKIMVGGWWVGSTSGGVGGC